MGYIKIILVVILVIIGAVLLFLNYMSFFTKIIIKELEIKSLVLVYDDHIGDYKGTREVQDRIYYSLLNDYRIETYKGFGIYYDNPKEVSKNQLRSIAGCVLEQKDYDRIDELRNKGFKIKEIPEHKSIGTEFPYKNPLSAFIGIVKVYPMIDKYVKTNDITNSGVMEIYDIPAKKIIYLINGSEYK